MLAVSAEQTTHQKATRVEQTMRAALEIHSAAETEIDLGIGWVSMSRLPVPVSRPPTSKHLIITLQ
jgi:hypothetical protein